MCRLQQGAHVNPLLKIKTKHPVHFYLICIKGVGALWPLRICMEWKYNIEFKTKAVLERIGQKTINPWARNDIKLHIFKTTLMGNKWKFWLLQKGNNIFKWSGIKMPFYYWFNFMSWNFSSPCAKVANTYFKIYAY